MSDMTRALHRARRREERARELFDSLLVRLRAGSSPTLQRDVQDWLDGEDFDECSICRRRHRSDDRHPCE